jgi:hypothetical protein
MERATEDVATLLASAGEALAAGRWEEARDGFEATLKIEESGGAVFGLALALWWLRDPVRSVQLQERAFAMFRRDGDHENAFFAAMYVCLGYDMTFGNLSRPSRRGQRTRWPSRVGAALRGRDPSFTIRTWWPQR